LPVSIPQIDMNEAVAEEAVQFGLDKFLPIGYTGSVW